MGKIRYSNKDYVDYAHTGRTWIGSERRPINASGWAETQNAGENPVLAFSLVPVRVDFAGERPIVLSPATIAMTTVDGDYRRLPVSEHGQRSVILGLSGTLLASVVAEVFPESTDRPDDPFPSRYAPACPRAAAMACQLERIAFGSDHAPDQIAIEECVIRIIGRSISAIHNGRRTKRGSTRTRGTYRLLRERVNHVIACIGNDPARGWSLDELSDEADLSPAYLSRAFHAHTGITITRALAIMRVSRAIERLPDSRGKLTSLALSTGFSSHAHMSSVFTKLLGTTPSTLADASASRIRESLHALDKMVG